MALEILRQLEEEFGWRSNWVAMRQNLLRQVEEANENYFGLKNMTPLSMFSKEVPECDITVVDEAQHDAASSCSRIHSLSKSKVILGLSATPFRTDSLELCFQTTVKDAGVHKLIRAGWLSPFDQYIIEEWTPELVAETFISDIDRWGKSVVFFHKREHCEKFIEILGVNGFIATELVTGDIPFSTREQILDRFSTGETQVLVNMAILTEGFDEPSMKSVFVRDSCRLPTVQMAGRVLRIHPDVPVAQVIQSKTTRWNFAKTALPVHNFVHRDNKWYSLKPDTELINTTANQVIQELSTAPLTASYTAVLKALGPRGLVKVKPGILAPRF